ncbi:MAG: flagellar hook-associated protein FlgK [Candidatus Solibacter sp.]|nr:flagellar hook-associated protein FlgK [Candidatus Solibacter sp.]
MPNMLASLASTADTLAAYSRVLEATQSNVANASTPGYAKQRIDLYALPFDPHGGATGGVRAGDIQSARNEYAEQAVRTQTTGLGYQSQLADGLTVLQTNFDISGNQGIPQALNNLLQSFSAWGANPADPSARQAVLQRADAFAQAFNQTANSVAAFSRDTERQIGSTVGQINQIVGQIRGYNQLALQGNKNDAGLSARTHAALEQLTTLANVQSVFENDGTVSLTLNGQTPILLGDQQYPISASLYQAAEPPPVNLLGAGSMRLQASDGSEVTSSGGQLGALLKLRNEVIPSLIGDQYQTGDLNQMAKAFADRVNGLLTSGNVTDGPPPQAGAAIFTYSTGDATSTAASLSVDPAVTQDQLAAIQTGPPEVSNGIPLALSALAVPSQDSDRINGLSFSRFYGQTAGRVGGLLSDAQNNKDVQQSLLGQAKDLRQQYQGVSLDEEATVLMQFQRAYQANAKFLSVLDQLTQTAIDILRV